MFNTVEYRLHPTINITDGALIASVTIFIALCVTISLAYYIKACAKLNTNDNKDDKRGFFRQ